jgi:hypothetical protein
MFSKICKPFGRIRIWIGIILMTIRNTDSDLNRHENGNSYPDSDRQHFNQKH